MKQNDYKPSEIKKQYSSLLWGKLPTKESLKSFPVISIVASNVLVLIFTILEDQSVLNVLWIYWFQSVIIGLFNFLKILSLKKFTVDGMKMNNKPLTESKTAKIGTAVFFLVHYGIFHAVYAGFLSGFSSIGILTNKIVDYNFVLITSLVFLINYLIEFIFSYRKERDLVLSLPKLMMAPYKRIIPMHLTIIFSGFIMFGAVLGISDFSNVVLLVFIGLKTFSDLLTHQ